MLDAALGCPSTLSQAEALLATRRDNSSRSSPHTTINEAPTSGKITASVSMIATPVFHFGKS